MNHDILGEIQSSGANGEGTGTVRYGNGEIKISISADGEVFENVMDTAAEVVRRLPELDNLAKKRAVAELRPIYNNGWNEYDVVNEDGSLKTVKNPVLSEAEFERKLSLNAINVIGGTCVEFFYEDEGMFWGHSVLVISLTGIDFSQAHAEISG